MQAPRVLSSLLTVAPSQVLGPLGFPVEGKGGPGILQKEPKTQNKGRKTPEDKQGSMPVQRGHHVISTPAWTVASTIEGQEWAWAPRQGQAFQKETSKTQHWFLLPGQSVSLISRVPSATLSPSRGQSELGPWHPQDSSGLLVWVVCCTEDESLGLMHTLAPGWPSLSPGNHVYLHTTGQ